MPAKPKKEEAAEVRAALESTARPRIMIPVTDLLSSGSTLLNLALTNKAGGAYAKGCYYYFVGDSGSGKTWFVLTLLAEAARNPRFDNYRLIFDCPEGGALMDMEYYFGKKMTDRLEAPGTDKEGRPWHSETVEQFYHRLFKALNDERPCVYILDSMDVVPSQDDLDKQEAHAKVREKIEQGKPLTKTDENIAGSFGTAKAKCNSTNLRLAMPLLAKSGSILIIISQTRDNINAGPYGDKQTRAGGRALTFYATQEIWTSVKQSVKKNIRGKERVIGREVKLRVKKNRVAGRDRAVTVPFYYSHGIDDTGGCLSYLVEEGFWKPGNALAELGAPTGMNEEKMAQWVEANDKTKLLRQTVKALWEEIEAKTAVERRKRYD